MRLLDTVYAFLIFADVIKNVDYKNSFTTKGSKPKIRLLQVRSSPQLSIDGSNMFIRPLDAEIYEIQFLLTSAKVMLIKKSSPRWRTEDFSKLKDETLVVPKNKKSQSTYFFRVTLILSLQCMYYAFFHIKES